ncbi:AAA family ATPase [Agaribacter marinus]|uniref:Topology modulation protein n=1 Tax=Agaribacter marinus TaxID=1431249 RepID=A0AA37WJ23_9ALTE|nr:AAA family ATPase [Agaribacter marinus]GLR69844.1 topology modulation protein [Agaribacter marinus]
MTKTVIFGNSGSGKSTLASTIAKQKLIAHLDLDTIAWEPSSPPVRRSIRDARNQIGRFLKSNASWVVEGCYSDLLEIVLPEASNIIYLNLSTDACIENAKSRPWEPHKYKSKEVQDANLNMLIDWIKEYPHRTDTFSRSEHERLFKLFDGPKVMYSSNEHIA